VLKAATIIFALRQQADLSLLSGNSGVKTSLWDAIQVNPVNMQTSEPWIFAAGDVTTGEATVIEAVAAGQKAAVAIHCWISGEEIADPYRLVKPYRHIKHGTMGEAVEGFARPLEELRPTGERVLDFSEANLTLSERLAICETSRCLKCGMD